MAVVPLPRDPSSERVPAEVHGHSAVAGYGMAFEPLGRRVRVVFGGETVADSDRVMVLRETRHFPVYYFPRADVRMDLLQRSDHVTHCPFKGNASYWTLRAGDAVAENAAWSYERPLAPALAITDYIAFFHDRMDAWFEDGVQVFAREDTSSGPARENPFVGWLLHEAWEAANSRELTRRFVQAMRGGGIPVKRLRIIIQTLHPLLAATTYSWSERKPEVTRFDISHDLARGDDFMNSPLRPVLEGMGGIRRWIGAESEDDFPIMAELRAEGMTDYVAMPMIFSDGQINVITLATDEPTGFSTADLGFIHEVLPVLSRLYEVHAKRRNAVSLMRTFLGRRTGERVLDGLVRRGDGEDIHAVIWFCDMRDSTAVADGMSRQAFLDYLNRFFDCMAGAVMDHGGEVLRFVGDAVLAIFPIARDGESDRPEARDAVSAATAAVEAARQAAGRIAVLNGSAGGSAGGSAEGSNGADGRRRVGFGIGLHIGDVTYGNIGVPERLEFTVIGAAANEAARIEALTRELGVPIAMSAEVARVYPGETRSLGPVALRGIGAPVEVFTLPG